MNDSTRSKRVRQRPKTKKIRRHQEQPLLWPQRVGAVFANRQVRVRVQRRGQITPCCGVSLVHNLAMRLEIDRYMNRSIKLLKINVPYCESDHILIHGYALLHEMADSLPPSAWKPFSAHRPDNVAQVAADKKTRPKRSASPMDDVTQENIIEQFKNGIAALRMPTGELLANAAFLMAGQLAWCLRSWLSALALPKESTPWEWKWFRPAFVYIAAQITHGARRAKVYLAGSHGFVEHVVIASQRLQKFTFP